MVMGDLVLAEDEVAPVMAELQSGGIEITALHNHLIGETPRVMYMHIHGMGNAASLGKAIHSAIAKTKTPDAGAATAPPDLDIDTKQIDQILGHSGKNNGGIYQVGVPRAEHITEGGMAIPNSMGVATALNFQPTGGGKAAITGDFVLLAKEVNPVIKALRENGIAVTALHSHMLQEQPRLFFMHFWANDDALKLAKGSAGSAGPDQLSQEIKTARTNAVEEQSDETNSFCRSSACHGRAHFIRDENVSSDSSCRSATCRNYPEASRDH